MKGFPSRIAAVALLAVVFASPARACGHDLPYAVFAHPTHPDLPLEGYAAGRLGVIDPGWARSYLCMAYRWVEGPVLDAAEQHALVNTWLARDDSGWYPDASSESWVDAWRKERAKVPHVPLPVTRKPGEAVSPADLVTELHGPEDAFRTATRVLEEKLRTQGAASPAVRAWVLAQDTVFAACSGNAVGLALHAPGRVSVERAYQEAAYQMYAGEDADAAARFAALVHAPDPRLRPMAEYLVARQALREATFDPDFDSGIALTPEELAGLAHADSVIGAAMADTAVVRAGYLTALHRLRGYVRFRTQPVERMHELAAALMQPHSEATLGQDLWDLAWLMDRALGEWPVGNAADSTLRLRLREQAAANDLTDWVFTLQGMRDGGPFAAVYWNDGRKFDAAKDPRTIWWGKHRGDSYTHAVARWRGRRTGAWLVAALLAATPSSPGVDSLLLAASGAGHGWYEFTTIAARRAELLAERGDLAASRAVIDTALAQRELPVSAVNRLRAIRLRVATDAADLFRWVVRAPAAVVIGPDGVHPYDPGAEDWAPDSISLKPLALKHRFECMDGDGELMLCTRVPLERWREAAAGDALPLRLRGQLALAGWLRAVLIGHEPEALAFAPVLARTRPDVADDLARWTAAATPEERAFAAAFLVARRPGAQPFLQSGIARLAPAERYDDYRDNWWCATHVRGEDEWSSAGEPVTGESVRVDAAVLPGAYPTPADTAEAGAETAILARVPGGPDWFAPVILGWAKAHPDDPRVPEALHRVVRSVRLGCTGGRVFYGRDAFRILYARYPGNTWTKKTKSWS
jgi:hypothetical protein